MKRVIFLFLTLVSFGSYAQFPGGGGGNRGGQGMNMGRFYGKIVDANTNKGVDAASVQLIQNKFDTVSKQRKDVVVSGQLTKANGNFSLENLPIMAQYKLRISAIGYVAYEQPVKFDVKMGGDISQMMNMVDKDLGNIKMQIDSKQLEEVKIVATKPFFQMGVDRKIFNVDRNIVSVGQTATEVMKNIPGLSVDIDGNVSLRNASPTLFVDGRPTTLTLDQIPSDAIESVELITNPSAKFDASGGTAGIINIILKKNRKMGYNGNVRAGIDSRARFNLGGDINARQEKFNVFMSGMYNQRKSLGEGYSFRQNFFDTPQTNITQNINYKNLGSFAFARFGFDYFIDNRNTITVSQNLVRGQFKSGDEMDIITDTLTSPVGTLEGNRKTNNERQFRNYGTAIGYKRLFTKPGREITADLNFNKSRNNGSGDFTTQYFDKVLGPQPDPSLERTEGNGNNTFWTIQTDFVNPLGENSKMEAGLRAAIRDVRSNNLNYLYDYFLDDYVPIVSINANYKFNDRVYAAYTTYSNKIGKTFSYQLGARIESSKYTGTLLTTGDEFSNSFPFSFFPSIFVTKEFKNGQDLQFNYSRRINRPNFFQLIPFVDFTDSLNISRGNPDLVPEFTNSLEANYQKSFKGGHSILFSAYYKHTNNLITRFQVRDTSVSATKDVLINTFVNANYSRSYGAELTFKNPLAKWLEVTTNLNMYNARINSDNIDADLNNERWSFFGKMNASFKLPGNLTIQLSGDYRTRAVLPQSGGGGGGFGGGGGGRGGGGGGGWGGFTQTTAQGYINPRGSIDIAVRKEFLKNRAASISVSMNDIFKTDKYSVYSESPFFVQESWRLRDWRVVRLNFNYRFGKMDVSLFKRKNTRSGSEGLQEGMNMQQ
jgi:outer membrane receptor protein involved in Fe transport